MKVLIADKFEKSGVDGLKGLGVDVLNEPDLQTDGIQARLAESGAEILVVRSTKVPESAMEGTKLAVIIRAGAGYNTIDVEAASKLGIQVTNCPGKNSLAVVELAFGLMLACDRRIPDNVSDLRKGIWNKKAYSVGRGVYGRTLGLVGMGNIGQEMIPRAKAFGMTVIANSRWMTSEVAAALGIGKADNILDVARMADVVSIHVALTPQTKGSIGKEFFDAMKPGAIFINTSRAEVVDQAALKDAVANKGIVAGLDVFDGEPSEAQGEYDGDLKDAKNIYCTHHIGASTEQAQEAIAAEVVRIVKEFRATGVAPNVVNVQKAASASHLLVVRHLDKVGVLAHVLGALKDEGINVQEMENIVLGGAKAAIVQVALDSQPSDACLNAIKTNPNVFDASVTSLLR